MTIADVFKQYLEHLFGGKRAEARDVVISAQDRGVPASKLLQKVVWPAMSQVNSLYRDNRIPRIVQQMATQINRMVADQLQGLLARKPKSGKRIVVVSGDGEDQSLGAQIIADLFEAEGWSVWFVGSGVPSDEILKFVGVLTPDILCLHGAAASSVPETRRLIDIIREIGICEDMQILVTGGVFSRADGLADEVRADLSASDPGEALRVVAENPVRIPRPDVPQPGRRRKRKSRVPATALRRAKMVLEGLES